MHRRAARRDPSAREHRLPPCSTSRSRAGPHPRSGRQRRRGRCAPWAMASSGGDTVERPEVHARAQHVERADLACSGHRSYRERRRRRTRVRRSPRGDSRSPRLAPSCSATAMPSPDAVAITRAPVAWANRMAVLPTPPAPAWMRTVLPGLQVRHIKQRLPCRALPPSGGRRHPRNRPRRARFIEAGPPARAQQLRRRHRHWSAPCGRRCGRQSSSRSHRHRALSTVPLRSVPTASPKR